MESNDLNNEKQLDWQTFILSLKANPEAWEIFKKYVVEKNEVFKNIKSGAYEDLEKLNSVKDKCEFITRSLLLITDEKTKYEARIHENWTVEEKLSKTPKNQPIYEQLIKFYKELLETYSPLARLEETHVRKDAGSKHETMSFSLKQIAIAYFLMGITITKENAAGILKKHSDLKSADKLIQKRVYKMKDLITVSQHKASDTRHLKDLEQAERLINGTKNRKAKTAIKSVIVDFKKAYGDFY